jgi:CspA family cold shock protein
MTNRISGTIKFFNATKLFGFVICDDQSPDIYVGGIDTENLGELSKGDRIEFERGENGDRRARAVNVTVIERAATVTTVGGE